MARSHQIPAGDIEERQSEIQDLIAAAADEAFGRLIDFARDFGLQNHEADAIVISGEYYNYQKAQRQEVISFDEFSKKKKSLFYRILELILEIVNHCSFRRAA